MKFLINKQNVEYTNSSVYCPFEVFSIFEMLTDETYLKRIICVGLINLPGIFICPIPL